MASLLTEDEYALLGMPAAATAKLPFGGLSAHLQAASAEACASGLFSRYGGVITSVDMACKLRIARIADYTILSHRGFGPEKGSDAVAKANYLSSIEWFENVGGGLIHPVVTTDGTLGPGNSLPDVQSNPSRGWNELARAQDSSLPEEGF